MPSAVSGSDCADTQQFDEVVVAPCMLEHCYVMLSCIVNKLAGTGSSLQWCGWSHVFTQQLGQGSVVLALPVPLLQR
jgi:hypothetical protein